jgi:glyoxylase-like metal-dependent hydrolase (beta-lactamase superfamily II)
VTTDRRINTLTASCLLINKEPDMRLFFTAAFCLTLTHAVFAELSIHRGAVNGVVLNRNVAIYGAPTSESEVKHVLLTHHRRDVLRDAKRLAASGVEVVAPKAEEALIA